MIATAFDHFWSLVTGANTLNPDAFRQIQTLPLGLEAGLSIVLLAGLSEAIGQSIVLFLNRVKPLRFILSLLVEALLFGFSFVFWAISTWLVSFVLFQVNVNFFQELRTLSLSYAPLMLSLMISLPYLGVPIGVLLSIWSFLAFLTGLQAALEFSLWQAFICSAIGWGVFQIMERTIGRPVSLLGQRLSNLVAGVQLVTDLKAIESVVGTQVDRVRQRQ